jgi:hypothetical protein
LKQDRIQEMPEELFRNNPYQINEERITKEQKQKHFLSIDERV